MKIVEVKPIVVRNTDPHIGGFYWLFVKLVTDEGIVGLGERPTYPSKIPTANIELLAELAEEFVVGSDPFNIEWLWQQMYAARHDCRHPESALHTYAQRDRDGLLGRCRQSLESTGL